MEGLEEDLRLGISLQGLRFVGLEEMASRRVDLPCRMDDAKFMDTKSVAHAVEPNGSVDAPAIVDTVPASPDQRPLIRYATDAEVDEAMKKIFEWHGPLLKKLAE